MATHLTCWWKLKFLYISHKTGGMLPSASDISGLIQAWSYGLLLRLGRSWAWNSFLTLGCSHMLFSLSGSLFRSSHFTSFSKSCGSMRVCPSLAETSLLPWSARSLEYTLTSLSTCALQHVPVIISRGIFWIIFLHSLETAGSTCPVHFYTLNINTVPEVTTSHWILDKWAKKSLY